VIPGLPGPQSPAHYRIQVGGHLDDHWATRFGRLALTREDDGTTVLTGPVADQAELHGMLTLVRDLGVTLVGVAVIAPVAGPATAAPTGTEQRAHR
jgi:hypothetical protein